MKITQDKINSIYEAIDGIRYDLQNSIEEIKEILAEIENMEIEEPEENETNS